MEKNMSEKRKIKETLTTVAGRIGETTSNAAKKTTEAVTKTKEAVFHAIDQDGDGVVGIEDVIIMGLKVPGIRIQRDVFLRKELFKRFPEDVIEEAVRFNPMRANIPQEDIEKMVDEVIKYERICVSGISAALSTPGGATMVATIPADIAQYYGYMLRAAQKMLYLYGFPEIRIEEKEQTFDAETMNTLIVCMGVMYGVVGASNALKAMAKALGVGVEKQLLRKALTKGTIYPIVKSVSKWFGVKMTKEVFAGFFKKAIPVVGGVIGGGLTYASFKPCCDRLREVLQNTMLSNPNYRDDEKLDEFFDVEEWEIIQEDNE